MDGIRRLSSRFCVCPLSIFLKSNRFLLPVGERGISQTEQSYIFIKLMHG